MIKERLTIINKLGLHARAANKLVTEASRFESQTLLMKSGQNADAKSIMAVMMLAASRGTELDVQITGRDAEQAWQAIHQLVLNRFGEDE